jgi:hypothetical protein
VIWQYLKTDIKGAASRILYGEQGDRVHIIQNEDNLMLVINEKNEKFYVKADDVSSTPISKKSNNESGINKPSNTNRLQRVRSKRI